MTCDPETTARRMASATTNAALVHYLTNSLFSSKKQYLSPHHFVPAERQDAVSEALQWVNPCDASLVESGRAELTVALRQAATRSLVLGTLSMPVRTALAEGLAATAVMQVEASKHKQHIPGTQNTADTLLITIHTIQRECPGQEVLERWIAANMLDMMTKVHYAPALHEQFRNMLDAENPLLELIAAPVSASSTPSPNHTQAATSPSGASTSLTRGSHASKKFKKQIKAYRDRENNTLVQSNAYDHIYRNGKSGHAIPRDTARSKPHRRADGGSRVPFGPRRTNGGVSKSYKK
ncbi:hypothetical protein HDZ31DRAFT_62110 [Schizophyllum fasciatum]